MRACRQAEGADMANYEEKLLSALADKYRRSKKDSGTNVIKRRTKLEPSRLYKNYSHNDGDMLQIEAVNQAIFQCSEKGFITYETAGLSSEIRSIYLVDEKIDEIENYLASKYGYESKSTKKQYIEKIIGSYGGRSPVAELECEKLRRALRENRIPPKYQQTEDLLKALVFIENNKKDMYLREASSLIYGDSKYLEENTLSAVCRILREYHDRPCIETELEDEILSYYHITREKQKLCLKGDIKLFVYGKEIELSAFAGGIEFFADEIDKIEQIYVQTTYLTTVENYTSWLRCRGQGESFFYLGGYATRSQRDLLKKIYSDNPDVCYRHFGDIDAGGLYIHEHLCRVTGIPFNMYRMSCAELKDERFQSCLHSLTEKDRSRLESLKRQEPYRKLAEYMLERSVKLEQEIVSYYIYGAAI